MVFPQQEVVDLPSRQINDFLQKGNRTKIWVSVCTCPTLMTYDEVYYRAAPLIRLKAPGCPAKWPTLLLVTHQIGSCCLQQFNPVIISVCWIHSWREAKKFREQGAASQKKKPVTKLLISLLSPEIPLQGYLFSVWRFLFYANIFLKFLLHF